MDGKNRTVIHKKRQMIEDARENLFYNWSYISEKKDILRLANRLNVKRSFFFISQDQQQNPAMHFNFILGKKSNTLNNVRFMYLLGYDIEFISIGFSLSLVDVIDCIEQFVKYELIAGKRALWPQYKKSVHKTALIA